MADVFDRAQKRQCFGQHLNGKSFGYVCQVCPDALDCDRATLRSAPGSVIPCDRHGSALDVQVGGQHYKDMKIQPVEFIHANNLGFLAGNVIKYVCRYRAKAGVQDLEKARHYIDMLLEMEKQP